MRPRGWVRPFRSCRSSTPTANGSARFPGVPRDHAGGTGCTRVCVCVCVSCDGFSLCADFFCFHVLIYICAYAHRYMGLGWWEQPIIHSAHIEFGEDDGGLLAMLSILSKLDLGPGSAGGGGGGGGGDGVGARSEEGTSTGTVTGAVSNGNEADPHHSNSYHDSSQVMQRTSDSAEVHAGPVVGEGGTRPCVLPHRTHTPPQNAELLSTRSSHQEGEGKGKAEGKEAAAQTYEDRLRDLSFLRRGVHTPGTACAPMRNPQDGALPRTLDEDEDDRGKPAHANAHDKPVLDYHAKAHDKPAAKPAAGVHNQAREAECEQCQDPGPGGSSLTMREKARGFALTILGS
jgi:hypothetical protein